MKKFLSILLALAVGFTFTFGSAMSAFAASSYTPTDETKNTLYAAAAEALTEATNSVDSYKAQYLKEYKDSGSPTITITAYDGTTDLVITKDAITYTGAGNALLDNVLTAVKAQVTKAYNDQIVMINTSSLTATANGTLAEAIELVKKNIQDTADGFTTSANITTLLKGESVTSNTSYTISADSEAKDALAEAEFNVKKAAAADKIEKARAVLGQYSTDVPKSAQITIGGTDMYYSNYEIAKLMLNRAEEAIDVDFDASGDTARGNTLAAMNGFETTVEKVVKADEDGKYFIYFDTTIGSPAIAADGSATFKDEQGKIYTITDTQKADKTLADEQAYQTNIVNSAAALAEARLAKEINAELEDDATTAAQKIVLNKVLADLPTQFAAAKEVAAAQISYEDNVTEVETLGTNWNGYFNGLTLASVYTKATPVAVDLTPSAPLVENGAFVETVADVAALEAKAAGMKTATGLDGKLMYDTTAVDKALKADKKKEYTTLDDAGALADLGSGSDILKAEMKKVLYKTGEEEPYNYNVTINKVVYTVIEKWQEDVDDGNIYDDDNAEAAQAVIDKTTEAVRAAKSVEDVDAAFLAGYAEFDAVPTLADQTKFQNLKTTKEAVSKYDALLDAALASKIADYGTAKFNKDYESTSSLVAGADGLVKTYIETAYDTAGLEAGYKKALNEITNLKTKADLAAEQKAINDEVLTLKNLTLADEAKVLALKEKQDTFKKYLKLIGLNPATDYITYELTTYVNQVKALAKADLDKQVAAIGTVTVDDEDAINKLVEAAAAYVDNYDGEYDVATIVENLIKAKIAAVEAAIDKINPSADPLDVDAIKAARAAYDALGENTINSTQYQKLLSLETLAGEVNRFDDTKAKAYANDLAHLKVNGKKLSNGKIGRAHV